MFGKGGFIDAHYYLSVKVKFAKSVDKISRETCLEFLGSIITGGEYDDRETGISIQWEHPCTPTNVLYISHCKHSASYVRVATINYMKRVYEKLMTYIRNDSVPITDNDITLMFGMTQQLPVVKLGHPVLSCGNVRHG